MITIDIAWAAEERIKNIMQALQDKGIIKLSGNGIHLNVAILSGDQKGYTIDKVGANIQIAYKEISDFCFAISLLIANADKYVYKASGENSFKGVYALTDCSRNAVRTVDTLKDFITTLALNGYKGLYLYIEDTYEVKGEPYFGYMRGRYTPSELKEIVEYAKIFHFEIIPAIQTLAHLTTMLRWDTYYDIADTQDIMMVEDDKTYCLIDKMLSSLRECFTTDKINLGMDEAHFIGLGGYLNKNGYKDRKELMLIHIRKVLDICKKYNFTDIRIWSDMLIKKYDKTQQNCLPLYEKIMAGHDDITLTPVFWDYYETDYEFYDRVIKAHKLLTDNVVFTCGGGFTWFGYTPLNRFANKINKQAVQCAKDNGVKELVVACWYDGGAEGSVYSGMATLVDCGAYNYADSTEINMRNDLAIVSTGYNFDELMTFDYPALTYDIESKNEITSSSKYLLYGDILNGTFEKNINEKFPSYYSRAISLLTPLAVDERKYSYAYKTMLSLSKLLKVKTEIQLVLRDIYKKSDREQLKGIMSEFTELKVCTDDFCSAVLYQWEKENKPFGNEALMVKLGGIKERLNYTINKITRYINGEIDKIEELEKEVLPYMTIANYDFVPKDPEKCNMVAFCFQELTTAGIL